jgi:hypothetical protein
MFDPQPTPLTGAHISSMANRGEPVTFYTDSFVLRGTLVSRHRRLSDALNEAEEGYVVVEQVTFEEFGSRAIADRAPYAQLNLATVLFAVAEANVQAMPEMRMPKIAQQAHISLPPFRILGHIHLPPHEELREGLAELRGRFVPVTDAVFWSERLNEPRTQAPMLAVNHARAQILAPYAEHDVWGDVPRQAEGAASGGGSGEDQSASAPPHDPWADLPGR